MPQVLQLEAERHPDRIFAVVPRSTDLNDGFREVTFPEVSRAVDSLAHAFRIEFGSPMEDFETLTYMGIPDIRYNIVFYGAVKAGFKVSHSLY